MVILLLVTGVLLGFTSIPEAEVKEVIRVVEVNNYPLVTPHQLREPNKLTVDVNLKTEEISLRNTGETSALVNIVKDGPKPIYIVREKVVEVPIVIRDVRESTRLMKPLLQKEKPVMSAPKITERRQITLSSGGKQMLQ